jgi:hypothetical protein
MAATRALTIYLDVEDYERLLAEADRLGVGPSAVAEDYVANGLTNNDETEEERRRRIGLRALGRLATLRTDLRQASYAPVDPAEVVEQGRTELEARPDTSWLSS